MIRISHFAFIWTRCLRYFAGDKALIGKDKKKGKKNEKKNVPLSFLYDAVWWKYYVGVWWLIAWFHPTEPRLSE